MDHRPLRFVMEATGAELVQGDPSARIERVVVDSRTARPGDLFVALEGERFDGHDFVEAAARSGVTAVLVASGKQLPDGVECGVLEVADTRPALGRLAARYRSEFTARVVAVAGSNGKTTTKELLASVVKQRFSTHWSPASYNNEVGVPLTLLGLEAKHEVAVVEAGTNHPGELGHLLGMIRPDWGVLTGIGREHLAYFGDLEGVVAEESELALCLSESGLLFVLGDDPASAVMAGRTGARVVRVGLGQANEADYRCNGQIAVASAAGRGTQTPSYPCLIRDVPEYSHPRIQTETGTNCRLGGVTPQTRCAASGGCGKNRRAIVGPSTLETADSMTSREP